MSTHTFRCITSAACVAFATAGTKGQVIDFETLPNGTAPQASDDDSPLSTPYLVKGIQITFGGDSDGDRVPDEPVFLERTGDNGDNAFKNGYLRNRGDPYFDVSDPGFEDQLGEWLLRSNSLLNQPASSLIIQYSDPVLSASGEIWDIETSDSSGPEAWRVSAIDATGEVVVFQDSPIFAPGATGGLDGEPWVFNLNAPDGFNKIAIEFVGTNPIGRGFAFNNFYATTTLPGPTLLTHQPDHASTNPGGITTATLFWSEPVTIAETDVTILDADDTNQPVPFDLEGSGTQITTITFTGIPGGPDQGTPVPMIADAYEITVRDTARAADNNAPIDGDNDGVAGGNATRIVTHYCPGDFNQNDIINTQDFIDFLNAFNAGCP